MRNFLEFLTLFTPEKVHPRFFLRRTKEGSVHCFTIRSQWEKTSSWNVAFLEWSRKVAKYWESLLGPHTTGHHKTRFFPGPMECDLIKLFSNNFSLFLHLRRLLSAAIVTIRIVKPLWWSCLCILHVSSCLNLVVFRPSIQIYDIKCCWQHTIAGDHRSFQVNDAAGHPADVWCEMIMRLY